MNPWAILYPHPANAQHQDQGQKDSNENESTSGCGCGSQNTPSNLPVSASSRFDDFNQEFIERSRMLLRHYTDMRERLLESAPGAEALNPEIHAQGFLGEQVLRKFASMSKDILDFHVHGDVGGSGSGAEASATRVRDPSRAAFPPFAPPPPFVWGTVFIQKNQNQNQYKATPYPKSAVVRKFMLKRFVNRAQLKTQKAQKVRKAQNGEKGQKGERGSEYDKVD